VSAAPGTPTPQPRESAAERMDTLQAAGRAARRRQAQEAAAPLRGTVTTSAASLVRLRDTPDEAGALPLVVAAQIDKENWPKRMADQSLPTHDAERLVARVGEVFLALGNGRMGSGAWCWPIVCQQLLKELDAIEALPISDSLTRRATATADYVPHAERVIRDMPALYAKVDATLQRDLDAHGVRLAPASTVSKDDVAEPEPDDRPRPRLITSLPEGVFKT